MTTRVQRAKRAASTDARDVAAPLRVGVIGATSMVARHAVIPAILASDHAELRLMASRTPDAVDPIAECRVADDYQAVLEDDAVDAVYVPLPNGLHRRWVEACAAAGKHVLVEKPMALDRADAQAMVDACESAGVVLMEAYMSPFHARNIAATDLIAAGRIGTPRTARAEFTFVHRDPTDHRWDPQLGGGALADVGIYVLSPLFDVAGSDLLGCDTHSVRTDRGVDATTSGMLTFANGFTATFVVSMELPERQSFEVIGTDGSIAVERPFTAGVDDTTILITDQHGEMDHIEIPGNDSYRSMIDHFCAVVSGHTPLRRPLSQSIGFATFLEQRGAR